MMISVIGDVRLAQGFYLPAHRIAPLQSPDDLVQFGNRKACRMRTFVPLLRKG
jgi:hypothetical protein